jgi:iron-sulfur cluster repair protein YtfE (RIC family)
MDASLAARNKALHEQLEGRLLAAYDAITALAFEEARAAWEDFLTRLEAHMRFEDEQMLPALQAVLLARDETEVLAKQIDGDHRILERTRDKVSAALARLERAEGDRRRAMVLELDTCLLMRRVLEHHTERETRLAYPLLDEALDEDTRAGLAAGLAL